LYRLFKQVSFATSYYSFSKNIINKMKKILLFLSLTLLLNTATLYAQCVKQITGSYSHKLIIKQDGTLWGWGTQNGTTILNATTPTQIGIDTDWKNVGCGGDFTIAIKENGTLWAWGVNNQSQLGDGTLITRSVPTQIGTATNRANLLIVCHPIKEQYRRVLEHFPIGKL
jgi:hypothetical protein